MYLVMFYQPYIKEHLVILSDPLDFETEEKFKEFCDKVKAYSIGSGLFRYKTDPDTDEPDMCMATLSYHKFVTDTKLPRAIEFKW